MSDPKFCPTCHRDERGRHDPDWTLRRRYAVEGFGTSVRNRRGRVRVRAVTQVPTGEVRFWPYQHCVGYDEAGQPVFEERVRRYVLTRRDVVHTYRPRKLRVKPSKGSAGYWPTHSRIVCVDKWHERHPRVDEDPDAVPTPRGIRHDQKRTRSKYIAKRRRSDDRSKR